MGVIERKSLALALAALVLLGLSGCGGSDAASGPTVKRPSAEPPLYHQTEYDLETTWNQGISDRRVGAYLESIWHDPASYSTETVVDSRPSDGAPSPMAAAELARVQVNWLPGYRERSFKKVKLDRQPAIRFAYDAAGESRIAYFFQHCGTSISFRGSAYTPSYESFAEAYGNVASTIRTVCD